ncbi:MAG: phage integrase N-terminal SAM-like domain-containing protein [Chromatiales bacterium]
MGAKEVENFLTHLAVAGGVSASTQNQAKSALRFLYKEVWEQTLPGLDNIESARRPKRLPVVLTRQEVAAILARTTGASGLIRHLLYGAGMRIMECLRLGVQDVDFGRGEILIREGKGFKDRVTMLPGSLANARHKHRARVALLHGADLKAGYGVHATRVGAEVSECRQNLVLAIRVSLGASVPRSIIGPDRTSSRRRVGYPAGHAPGAACDGHPQADHAAYAAA